MVKQICKAFMGLIENYKLNIKIDDRGIEWQIEQIRDRAKNKINIVLRKMFSASKTELLF